MLSTDRLIIKLVLINSAKEVMLLPLCVCLSVSRITQKCCRQILTKTFGGAVCPSSKSWLDFGGDPNGDAGPAYF